MAATRNTRRTSGRQGEATQAEPAPTEAAEPEAVPTAQEEQPTEAVPTVEELLAQLKAQQAEIEALKAKPVRRAREVKPTPKQIRFLRALIEDPTKSVPELCTTAGATETSHGFVFRMLEHGFLTVSVPASVIETYGLAGTEEPEAEETEAAEADAS